VDAALEEGLCELLAYMVLAREAGAAQRERARAAAWAVLHPSAPPSPFSLLY